jgi:photosystem II stability/assembly factor-like uncharacterized protein
MAGVTLSPNGLDRYRCPRPPEALLVATVDGVVELRRSRSAWWQGKRDLPGVHVSCVLADERDGAVLAGSHGSGIFRRRGEGPWEAASAGLTSDNVFSLAMADDEGTTVLYAGTEPALLFRSRDGGASWLELTALRDVPGREGWDFPAPPHVAHVKHVDVDPRDARTFYVSVEQGALLKTVDGGERFRQLVFRDESYVYNDDVHRVVINPLAPDEIYVTGGDGITRSNDGGEHWGRVATPTMRVGYPDATFCSPARDGIVYVTGAAGTPGTWRRTGDARATMVRSRDRGRTWEQLPIGDLRGNIEAATLVSWPDGYGFFVGTTDGEVYASADRGGSWTRIAAGLPAISKCVHARNVAIGRGAA